MVDQQADWLVLGTSPLAHLLAGLLQQDHGAKVILAGAGFSEWSLPRGLDLSVMPATRPESWALLNALVPETIGRLESAGAGESVTETSAMLVAESSATIAAFQHMRHVAMGYGHKVERQSDVEIGEGAVGYRFAGARRIDRARALPALSAWLDRIGVRRVSPEAGSLTLRRDGSSRVTSDDETMTAAQTVFADDGAILQHLGPSPVAPLATVTGRVLLTERARPLPAPAMIYYDRGASLSQRPDGSLVAQIIGPRESAFERLGTCLVAQGALRRAAEADFEAITSRDGAPVISTVRGSRAALFAGLGPAALFFAPMLARHLAARSTDAEKAWLGARGLGRAGLRTPIVDFAVPLPGGNA